MDLQLQRGYVAASCKAHVQGASAYPRCRWMISPVQQPPQPSAASLLRPLRRAQPVLSLLLFAGEGSRGAESACMSWLALWMASGWVRACTCVCVHVCVRVWPVGGAGRSPHTGGRGSRRGGAGGAGRSVPRRTGRGRLRPRAASTGGTHQPGSITTAQMQMQSASGCGCELASVSCMVNMNAGSLRARGGGGMADFRNSLTQQRRSAWLYRRSRTS